MLDNERRALRRSVLDDHGFTVTLMQSGPSSPVYWLGELWVAGKRYATQTTTGPGDTATSLLEGEAWHTLVQLTAATARMHAIISVTQPRDGAVIVQDPIGGDGVVWVGRRLGGGW